MRRGKFTASEIWKLFTEPRTKADKEAGKWSQTSEAYILEKAIEEMTGYRPKFTSKEMEHGIITEPEAFQAFQQYSDLKWDYCSSEFFPIGDNAGASPDGVAYDDLKAIAVVDIKCPQPLTFFGIRAFDFGHKIDTKYFYQLQMQMIALRVPKAYLCYYLASEFGNTYTGEVEAKFDIPMKDRLMVFEVPQDPIAQTEIMHKIKLAEQRKQEIINTLSNGQ